MLMNIIGANLIIGLIGVGGSFLLSSYFVRGGRQKMMSLVSFAAGSMIAVSFFDLVPEALEANGNAMQIMQYLVLGFVVFLLIEKAFLFHHCHEENCAVHSSAKLIILGDTVHNLLDGVAIAASFLVGPATGILTTIAIIIHEIPQEVGDVGVLLHAGYSKSKALAYNILSALAAVVGGLIGFFALNSAERFLPYILALTAGGFVYIAAADLLPKMHNESNTKLSISFHSFIVISGIVVIWLLGKYVGE